MSPDTHYNSATADANIRRTLSLNLRLLRLLNGWSQEQLAERSGLHRTYIGAVERLEVSIGIDNLQRLAEALDTSPTALLNPEYSDLPGNIRETTLAYISRQHERQNVVDMQQFAIFRLWTISHHSLVMAPYESQCKEATGPAGATDAHPTRLVTGSTRRAQRTQPQLYWCR